MSSVTRLGEISPFGKKYFTKFGPIDNIFSPMYQISKEIVKKIFPILANFGIIFLHNVLVTLIVKWKEGIFYPSH
jgi:hypothetical protein